MKQLVDEKFDVNELIEDLLGENHKEAKQRKVRLDLGLIGENTITVDGKRIPLPSGVNRLTTRAVKEIAGKYQGFILAREDGNGKAVTLDDNEVIDAREEDTFRTQKPRPEFRTLPRLGLD